MLGHTGAEQIQLSAPLREGTECLATLELNKFNSSCVEQQVDAADSSNCASAALLVPFDIAPLSNEFEGETAAATPNGNPCASGTGGLL
jgi:hypothetical protein